MTMGNSDDENGEICLTENIGKHPTTGGAIASPFVQMSQNFQKQANNLWYEIFDIVKQNCTTSFESFPQDDMMERLLRARK